MRHFSVILCCCLAALASADKLGYNYQPVAHSGSGLSFAPGGSASNLSPSFAAEQASSSGRPFSTGGEASNLSPSFSAGPAPAASSDNFGISQSPFAQLPSFQPSGPIAEQSADAPNYAAAQPELQKEFFTYTADEEEFQDPAASEKVSSSLNKALRVVFVKGPDNSGLEQAALALAKQASQQETAIYVLNKQADINDLANKLNDIRRASSESTNNKPEVHFVKYRTPEDAANAQRAIQSQYDQLGGASSHQDGGVASSLNFASSAPAPSVAAAPAPGSGSASIPSSLSASLPSASDSVPVAAEPEANSPISSYVPPVTPGSTYLPANILRRLRF
ncbi:hypothetical protein KR093_005742 [Drosophila rubida]|uniref:DUF243 domain-containing protein n=1 Tax=Drosophila rubida TaxID=30044 RepID=A0AAD4PH36_9MUSC|nr:hypothetical protein KR093_005742 [Drosophila rubida]